MTRRDRSDRILATGTHRISGQQCVLVEEPPRTRLVNFRLGNRRLELLLPMPWVYLAVSTFSRFAVVTRIGARPTMARGWQAAIYQLPVPHQFGGSGVCNSGGAERSRSVAEAIATYWEETWHYQDAILASHYGLAALAGLDGDPNRQFPFDVPALRRDVNNKDFIRPYQGWEQLSPQTVRTLPWGLHTIGTAREFLSGSAYVSRSGTSWQWQWHRPPIAALPTVLS